MSFRMSSALLLIKSLSAFPAPTSSSSPLVSKRACGQNPRSRINVFEWRREEGYSGSSPLWHLQSGQVCSPVVSFDIVAMVEGEGERMGSASGSGHAENKDVGKSIGKVEGERDDAGNVKGFGKSIGESEDETVGKSIGKVEAEGSTVGNAKGVGKSVGKSEVESVGKSIGKVESEGDDAGNARGLVGKCEGVGKSVGKVEGEGVDADSVEYVIAVAGKSAVEKEFAESLTKDSDQTFKLPEGATLVVYQQTQKNKEDEFRANVFMDQLPTLQFGRLLFYAHQLPSTHTLLSQNCKTLPVGALSVADVQFQGKGRAGNAWESPKGCLMFSFTLQMADGRAVPFVQYVVSLAVIEGIEDLCKNKDLKAPEVKIKWPNDLYAKGLKVGGVLCTSTYSAKKFHIVVGVGLNVGNRQPTTCLDALLEEINEQAPCLSRDELLAVVMGKFEELFNLFSTQGFYALETKYYERWLHSGQTVVLEEKEEGSVEVSKIPLKIQGLTPAGYLRAVDDDSETYELHPDGNSFDFLKGLVRKKM